MSSDRPLSNIQRHSCVAPRKLAVLHIIIILSSTAIVTFSEGNEIVHRPHELSRSSVHDHSKRHAFFEYGVVIDAGSSGSRVWVYKWLPRTTRGALPNIEVVFTHKVQPGLADYADDMAGMTRVIADVIAQAKEKVPPELQDVTAIYLFATAGMRLLWESKAATVVDYLDGLLRNKTVNPFYIDPEHGMRILSGEEEGVFAWLALNYLAGAFRHTRRGKLEKEKTVGMLELGGASTQIAFIPQGTLLANKFPLRLARRRYPLYVHSYLKFGQDYVDNYIKDHLKRNDSVRTISDPCMLRGDRVVKNATFNGTGDPIACLEMLKQFVYKSETCYPKPCAIGMVYQPSLPQDKTFYALGAFVHALTNINAAAPDGSISLPDAYEKALTYCRKDFETVKRESKEKPEYLSKTCLTSLYLQVLFTQGYGFREDTKQIKSIDKIDGKDIDWTLGALLYEKDYAHDTAEEAEADSPCPCMEKTEAEAVLSSSSTILSNNFIVLISTITIQVLVTFTQ